MYDHFYYIRLLVEFQCFRYSGILYVGTNIAARQIQVKEHARKSVRALLEANKRLVEEQRANVTEAPAQKKSRGEELG